MLLGVSAPTLSRPRLARRATDKTSGRRPRLTTRTFERVGAVVVCLCAAAGFFLYPTYPNYDSVYSLLWGRELLHLEPLSFEAYRAPTEHPLAIAIGAVLSLFGDSADRLFVALMVASFVALVFGLYALGRTAFTPLVGVVAAVLVITRFDFPFLAARGYIDPLYLALVIWAAVLELRRPRRGWIVLVLLALAAMLRPEAWLLAGLYVLWAGWRASWPQRIGYAALAALGPVVWVLTDFLVTGNPTYSFTGTTELADELGRNKGAGAVPAATWSFLIDLAKFPVVLGAIAGFLLALVLVPRRLIMPRRAVRIGRGDVRARRRRRPVGDLPLPARPVAHGDGAVRRRGRRLDDAARRHLAAAHLGRRGAAARALRDRLHGDARQRRPAGLPAQLPRGRARRVPGPHRPAAASRRGSRCGPVWTPNHKLVPDARWYLDLPQDKVIARSSTDKVPDKGVVILVHGRQALFNQALVTEFDDPMDSLPPPGFRRVAVSEYYAAYVRC